MSGILNEIRRNGTGVPGLRLQTRRGYLCVDVTWYREDGRRGSTSYPVGNAPMRAVRRAMARRFQAVGAVYDITPRQAWQRLKQAQPQ